MSCSGLPSYSQSRQDVWLATRVFDRKRDGVFVEIGAFDGISFSNCYLFEKAFGWRGLCIEPHPRNFEKLRLNRSATCLNLAVGDSEGDARFRLAEMLSGLVDTYDPRHASRVESEYGREKSDEVVEVRVRDLGTILREAGLTAVDYLSVDVEGAEWSIVRGLGQLDVPITAVTLENNFRDPALVRAMEEIGYIKISELGADDVFVRRGFLPSPRVRRLRAAYRLAPARILEQVIAPRLKAALPEPVLRPSRALWRRIRAGIG